jgi:hypothetical protein
MPMVKCEKCGSMGYIAWKRRNDKGPCPVCAAKNGFVKAVWGADFGFDENGERFGKIEFEEKNER